MSKPGLGPNPLRVRRAWGSCPSQSAIGPWDWSFHIVRGGADLGELDFHRQGVRGVEIWKDI